MKKKGRGKAFLNAVLARIWHPTCYYTGPASDHFDGAHFYNPDRTFPHSWKTVLKWKMRAKPKPWPKAIDNQLFDLPPARVEGDQIRVSFVGHATVLIQTQGINILTDPIWAQSIGPFKWASVKRVCRPGIRFETLPKIDVVLISHNHYDHLNLPTIKKIWQRDQAQIIAPLGNDAIISAYDPSIRVQVLDWLDAVKISDTLSIYLEPAQHWSARWPWDKNKALWGAFVIKTPGGNLYFAGDTGYGQGSTFRHAKKKFGTFRFAMLPIGTYEPRWFMRFAHMNPEDAVCAHHDLGNPYTLAIHFATFRLADEGIDDPVIALQAAKIASRVPEDKFRAIKPGQAWLIP